MFVDVDCSRGSGFEWLGYEGGGVVERCVAVMAVEPSK